MLRKADELVSRGLIALPSIPAWTSSSVKGYEFFSLFLKYFFNVRVITGNANSFHGTSGSRNNLVSVDSSPGEKFRSTNSPI